MSYKMLKKPCHKTNYGAKRDVKNIKYIVIHYTGNTYDTAQSNGNFFARTVKREVSSHYYVDSSYVVQSVEDNYIAWHCGAVTYKHKSCRNANSLSIEICDDIKDNKYNVSKKTVENAVALTISLMKKYNIPKENVIRHYDVTGKKCPVYWVDNAKWKSEFHNKLIIKKPYPGAFPTIELHAPLKLGAKGDNVRRLQNFLKWAGFYGGNVDGDFGRVTDSAVRQFQIKYNLVEDGWFGQKSLTVAKTIEK